MSTVSVQNLYSQARAASLMAQAGFTGPFALDPVHGGANSRAFRVERSSGPALFFKEYFRHADDPRDRLGTEFAVASFAWDQGLRNLAQPFAMDRERGCALYAFLDGRKLEPHEVTPAVVEQSLLFFRALNASKAAPQAVSLPIASEACFSLDEHWACLDRRLRRLGAIAPYDALDRQALDFVDRKLIPAAAAYLQSAHELAGAFRLNCSTPLKASDRCLSPSDFGFHNALRGQDGTLFFLDFEYAGWDDPAKTVCDFFCQPACPAPIDCYAHFAAAVAAETADPMLSRRRFDLLLPMYRLKWCCIMLNDFLPAGAGRRRFAIHGLNESERKERQLRTAQAALQQFANAKPANLAA